MYGFKKGDKVKDRYGNVGTVTQVYESLPDDVHGNGVVRILNDSGFDYLHESNLFEFFKSGSDSDSETKVKELNMQTISITVEGVEMEKVTLTFDEVQVQNLYSESKVMKAKIVELEKQVKQANEYKEMYSKLNDESKKELESANILLTALNVQEKDNNENEYYRKVMPVATRIALYIANQKQA